MQSNHDDILQNNNFKKIIHPKTGFALYLKPFKDFDQYSQILTDSDINPPAPKQSSDTISTRINGIKKDIKRLQHTTNTQSKETTKIIKQLSRQNKLLNYAVAGLSIGLMLSILF